MSITLLKSRPVLGFATVLAVVFASLALTPMAPASAATGPAPIEQRSDSTVTADPLPTVQIDSGVVWTQVIIGDTVFAGGSFSNARPAGAAEGTNLMPRSNILAYNINTGVATSFAPVINGQVKALAASPDGRTLYVGGTFNSVNGQTRWNFAAFNAATGALLTTFRPAVGGSYVNAIVATDSAVYVGGLIGAGAGVTRKNFAAFNSTNGALLGWAPTSDLQVDAMVLSPTKDKIIVGGRFSTINDAPQRGLAALDLVTGSLLPWQAPATVVNGAGSGTYKGKAGIFALSADENSVYGTGWVYANVATGNLEGTFAADAASGSINWIADCHGDHYGVYSDGTNVYTTSHQHACESMGGPPQSDPAPENLRHATAYTAAAKGTLLRSPWVGNTYANWEGYPAPAGINWFPDWVTGKASGQGQAGWTVTGNGEYVVVGGEFPFVNGQRQQGLVRFSNEPQGGPKNGPRWSGDNWSGYSAKSNTSGTVRVAIPANWDRDDLSLSYSLFRSGTPGAIQTTDMDATFWNRPIVSFVDKGRTPGTTETYRVVATDPDGNSVNSNWFSVDVSGQSASPYAEQVLDDGANLYWRLGNASGGTETDWAGANNGTIGAVSPTSDGAIPNDVSKASTFTGTTSSLVSSAKTVPVGAEYSVEFWVKTTTTSGGKIAGFGRSATGNSSSYDRHVYMTNAGKLIYGNYDGSTRTITSARSYNDGRWHHVVGTQGASGMTLYVDGESVGTNAAKTAESYPGYWRVGGDNLGGWPESPRSTYLAGQIDEFAVYPTQLTAQQALAHHTLGTGQQLPVAAFEVDTDGLDVAVDGSSSTVPAGQSVQSYSWDFGDGSAATSGATSDHSYDAAGTYTVSLTVRSSSGLVSTTTREVTVAAPHAAPVARITTTVDGLTGRFDSSTSSASDGATIASARWTFGDGTSSTELNPSHRFSAAGTYPVTLTVVDSLGASSVAAATSVTVEHAAPVADFSAAVSGLSVETDAARSSASDDATLTYAWNWGDGSATSTGVTASHTYATAGPKVITLTVTDSVGATTTTSTEITATAQQYLAQDDFTRTLATGWGTATLGGAWSAATGLSVANNTGRIVSSKGQTKTTTLAGSAGLDTDTRITFSTDVVANGGGSHFNLLSRKTQAGDYRLKVRTSATGVVTINLARVVNGVETLFPSRTLTGYTYTAGDELSFRLKVTSSGSSTQLEGKGWLASDTEPTAWTTTAVDSTPELQVAGTSGISTYLTGSVTNAPVTTTVDTFSVE
ncbi:PKD domain-containing protein [Marisediminicola sp. LYQ85]|uniref:PKD domain-containing protein n=1 Tax=Marisediminicola sp. LYQ85 TaxID=3391062 RepID=UPI003983AF00